MTNYIGNPKLQFFYPGTQTPLVGGKLYTYISGTNTNIDTYPTPADFLALTNKNTNPIILDSSGCTTVVLTGATRFTLKDATDNLIWTVDGIQDSSLSAGSSIVDVNGNELVKFTTASSAVNEINIANAATGNAPAITASGNDTNINLTLAGKGTGRVVIPNLTVTSTVLIPGDTTATAIPTGYVGEIITSTVSAVSLTSNTLTNLTSLALTAGTWDLFGSVTTAPNGTTTTSSLKCGFNTTSVTLPTAYAGTGAGSGAGVAIGTSAPIARYAISSGTTVYFVVNCVFAVSTLTASATVWAERIL